MTAESQPTCLLLCSIIIKGVGKNQCMECKPPTLEDTVLFHDAGPQQYMVVHALHRSNRAVNAMRRLTKVFN